MNEHDIGMLIKQLYDAKEKRANEKLKQFGLTFSQFRLLIYIHEQGEVSLKEMEHYFSLTQQTVAGIIKRLEEKGFVITCADSSDKRAKNVQMTEKGDDSYQKAIACYQQAQDLLIQDFSTAEKNEFQRLLTMALQNIKKGEER